MYSLYVVYTQYAMYTLYTLYAGVVQGVQGVYRGYMYAVHLYGQYVALLLKVSALAYLGQEQHSRQMSSYD
jgi:hypothetical protein